MNKNLKKFSKELKNLIKLIEDNEEAFQNFNFKLYNVVYDYDDNKYKQYDIDFEWDFGCYCDNNWLDFKNDIQYNLVMNDININEVGRTSSRFLSTDYLSDNKIEYNFNDLTLLFNDIYTEINLLNNLKSFLNDIKDSKKRYFILKHCLINDYDFTSFSDNLKEIKLEYIKLLKAYHYIMSYKNCVDNVDSFIKERIYSKDCINILKNLKRYNVKIVPQEIIDIIYDSDCLIKKAGHFYKIYYSLANNPIILNCRG